MTFLQNFQKEWLFPFKKSFEGTARISKEHYLGKGQNYENQNVENQKEHWKPCKPSQRRKDLLKRSECRKGKRSLHQKDL